MNVECYFPKIILKPENDVYFEIYWEVKDHHLLKQAEQKVFTTLNIFCANWEVKRENQGQEGIVGSSAVLGQS